MSINDYNNGRKAINDIVLSLGQTQNMIIRYAPILSEVKDILNKSSTYINKKGKHPDINSCLDPYAIGTEWIVCIKDNIIANKMEEQIATMRMYKESILILN